MATPTVASSTVSTSMKPGYYSIELANNDTWTVPQRYKDFMPIGSGGFSTV